jgi:hypothetical protein
MEQFIRVVKGIDDFWFGIVRLPWSDGGPVIAAAG